MIKLKKGASRQEKEKKKLFTEGEASSIDAKSLSIVQFL